MSNDPFQLDHISDFTEKGILKDAFQEKDFSRKALTILSLKERLFDLFEKDKKAIEETEEKYPHTPEMEKNPTGLSS